VASQGHAPLAPRTGKFLRSKVERGRSAGEFFRKESQEIPDEFLEDIRDRREASGSRLTDYTEPVARIPQIVADELARDGIDIVRMWRDHPFELVQILRKRGYDNLFTTTKRIV
jgi:hypothetical protein